MAKSNPVFGWRAVGADKYVKHHWPDRMTRIWTVKVDVDRRRPLSLRELEDRLKKNNRALLGVVQRRSPSGRGWHRWIGVWPRPTSAVETVALQLLCGSDPHREAYNLNRARMVDSGQVSDYWRARWNTLYRKEHNAQRR